MCLFPDLNNWNDRFKSRVKAWFDESWGYLKEVFLFNQNIVIIPEKRARFIIWVGHCLQKLRYRRIWCLISWCNWMRSKFQINKINISSSNSEFTAWNHHSNKSNMNQSRLNDLYSWTRMWYIALEQIYNIWISITLVFLSSIIVDYNVSLEVMDSWRYAPKQ